ncbi:MAG TPA: molybdopterin molybdotransferase MoeA [Anaerolineae bacterium]|nr:molybdopterin molybdotransferase MoeA [Anaerolineae bacterium]HOG47028.1 molybdopterin molybdotransferase MoeA [Anaerolineae bacterium]HOR01307.1 molybdopterin molybdotransferase MoeA [Anaerolineae bacterium]HPL29994.1 molybdopterin molybdotransferase MoeA [Anaerolineae bacterium]
MPEEILLMEVEQARQEILAQMRTLEPEQVPLLEALGRTLAEEIAAGADIPPFDNSAMDGYAVRAADVADATLEQPVALQVIATLAAGEAPGVAVQPQTAIRIMTGAPLPPGADAVVPFEDTDEGSAGAEHGRVRIASAVRSGANVRQAGEDVRRGEVVLRPGTVLRPAEIGLLASLGRPRVAATRRPRVAVIATGDELVDIDAPLGPGQIRNSNGYANAAQVLRYGGTPLLLPIARDTMTAVTARIEEGIARGADLFLTSGGVSVGDYDLVKRVLHDLGQIDFWRVRMQPGKPMAFGGIRGVPLIGLPGNPVSAMVVFEQFARPAIFKMLGRRRLRTPEIEATLLDDAKAYADRVRFLRAIVTVDVAGHWTARLTGPQGSGVLSSMVRANGLAIIPKHAGKVPAGTKVWVQMLEWPETE